MKYFQTDTKVTFDATGKSDITFNWMITVCDGSLETNRNFPSAKICNGNIKTISVVAQYLNPEVGSGLFCFSI